MTKRKTTGHIVLYTFLAALVALAITLGAAPPARALDLELTTANDPVSGNERDDDLYTAELALELRGERRDVAFGERMFTDKERGRRFDETWVETGWRPATSGPWSGRIAAGVLRVGRGLAGESAQNEIHGWIGSDRVDLEYVPGEHWYPTVRLGVARRLPEVAGAMVSARGELFAAGDFRAWWRTELVAERRLVGDLAVRVAAGLRVDEASDRFFADRVDDAGATAAVGLGWRRWSVTWSVNDYGTSARHLRLGVRLGSGAGRRAPGS